MGPFCCHGNQSFDPTCPKTLCNLSPTLMICHIRFDQDWPTGLRDIQVSSELWQNDRTTECWKDKANPVWPPLFQSGAIINVYSHRSGADNPRGQIFDVNRNLLSLRSFATGLKKNLFEVWFYTMFFMILYMYVAPEQGPTTPWGQNFDVNRNILSLRSAVASFQKISI